MQLTEMLAREGAPWRPFEETGVLVKPLKTPRSAAAIFAACEKTLVSHLKAVCLWPAKDRNQSWRVGDYSYYILEFEPTPKTLLYVQFWSEPNDDDGVLFEVWSGAMNTPAADRSSIPRNRNCCAITASRSSGNADNFRKTIKIENARDVRAVAREAMAMLCKVLGYDGRQELRFNLRPRDQLAAAPRVRGHRARGFRHAAPGVGVCGRAADAVRTACRSSSVAPTTGRLRSRCSMRPRQGQYQSATLRVFRSSRIPARRRAWRMPSTASSACCRRAWMRMATS